MQAIMWLILGATIGAAALLDRAKHQQFYVRLGDPTAFEGFTINLPADWDALDTRDDSEVVAAMSDPKSDDKIIIARGRGGSIGTVLGKIQIGDYSANLIMRIHRKSSGEITELIAWREVAGELPLEIILFTDSLSQRDELQSKIDLMKRVAATVRIHSSANTET